MKPGPKPDPLRAYLRELFAEWSDRTFTTYWRATSSLRELVELGAITQEERKELMAKAHRPNGSVNVSKFARVADSAVMAWVIETERTAAESSTEGTSPCTP